MSSRLRAGSASLDTALPSIPPALRDLYSTAAAPSASSSLTVTLRPVTVHIALSLACVRAAVLLRRYLQPSQAQARAAGLDDGLEARLRSSLAQETASSAPMTLAEFDQWAAASAAELCQMLCSSLVTCVQGLESWAGQNGPHGPSSAGLVPPPLAARCTRRQILHAGPAGTAIASSVYITVTVSVELRGVAKEVSGAVTIGAAAQAQPQHLQGSTGKVVSEAPLPVLVVSVESSVPTLLPAIRARVAERARAFCRPFLPVRSDYMLPRSPGSNEPVEAHMAYTVEYDDVVSLARDFLALSYQHAPLVWNDFFTSGLGVLRQRLLVLREQASVLRQQAPALSLRSSAGDGTVLYKGDVTWRSVDGAPLDTPVPAVPACVMVRYLFIVARWLHIHLRQEITEHLLT